MTEPHDGSIASIPPVPPPVSRFTRTSPRLRLFDWGGEGVPVLMLHGMGGNGHWWDLVSPRLRPSYRPMALDFRAHGESAWVEDKPYSLESWLEDIGLAADEIGAKRFVLAGHSLGARLAVEWAAAHPERLLGLALVDFLPEFRSETMSKFERAKRLPRPFYRDKESAVARFRLEPRGTILGDKEMRRLAEASVKPFNGGYTWKFDWRAIQSGYGAVWPFLPKLSMPVLIVRGGKSIVMLEHDTERIASQLKDVTTLLIPEALHHVPLDSPEKLSDSMLRFLRERVLSRSAP
ncbi:MAG: alpha/beta hydrolase [Elusimicrobia bacterium]|nr:alpha/beta hydrolase [Elusimicrobiota bacterium]